MINHKIFGKTFICLLMCVTVTAGIALFDISGEKNVTEEAKSVSVFGEKESGNYALSIDSESGIISVENYNDNIIFRSNPKNYQNDIYAKGSGMDKLSSQLIINVCDESGVISEHYSSQNIFSEDIEKIDNGYECRYIFKEIGISVKVRYTVQGNVFKAEIPLDSGIEETGEYRLLQISLLPFFGASSTEDSGYIFVPDGCGGQIDFNNGKQFSQSEGYLEPVYGRDKSVFLETMEEVKETIHVPVFGMIYENSKKGFFAHISDSAAQASIGANVSGAITGYNNVYALFDVRSYSEVSVLDRTWASKTYILSSKDRISDGSLTVEYYLLGEDNSSFAGIAKLYRNLLELQGLENQEIKGYAAFIDTYMGVSRKKQFLGFVYNGYEPLTALSQAESIAEDFYSGGVDDIYMSIIGADSAGAYYGKITTDINLNRKIGSLDEYSKFQNYLSDKGGGLFYKTILSEFSKSSWGYNAWLDSARAITDKTIKCYEYRYSNLERRLDIGCRYLLRPEKVLNASEELLKNIGKKEITGVSITDIAIQPYSSYNDGKLYTRADFCGTAVSAMKNLASETELMVNSGADYAITIADILNNMPTETSNSSIIDREVPFLPMVLHGYLPYAGKPLNLAGDTKTAMLKTIACGASPNFAFFCEDYEKIIDTPLEYLYGGAYSKWKDEALEIVQMMQSVLQPVVDLEMTDFKYLTDGVAAYCYGGNRTVVVNYTTIPYQYGNTMVQPESAALVKEWVE